MLIRELTLNNFRSFRTGSTFDFAGSFRVIAGINGRGKTSILDALALVISRLLPQISPSRGDYIWYSGYDITGDQEESSVEITANCAGVPVNSFRVSRSRDRSRTKVTRLSRAVRREIRNRYGTDRRRPDDAAPLAVYYSTDRAGYHAPRTLPPNLPEAQGLAYFRALTKRTINYRDLMYYLSISRPDESVQAARLIGTTGERAYTAITRCLGDLLGGFTNPRVEIAPLRLIVEKGGQSLDVAQLSDGERSFFAIIADLCRRLALANPELEDPLQGEGVVLIDEIELHLHPKWQTEVVHKLRTLFPRIQFIATTHSPYVIRTLEPNELILLDDNLVGDFSNKGLEEVSAKVMNLDSSEMTPRYREMLDVAKAYFQALQGASSLDAVEREDLKARLAELTSPYADNPAYQAFLDMHRAASSR